MFYIFFYIITIIWIKLPSIWQEKQWPLVRPLELELVCFVLGSSPSYSLYLQKPQRSFLTSQFIWHYYSERNVTVSIHDIFFQKISILLRPHRVVAIHSCAWFTASLRNSNPSKGCSDLQVPRWSIHLTGDSICRHTRSSCHCRARCCLLPLQGQVGPKKCFVSERYLVYILCPRRVSKRAGSRTYPAKTPSHVLLCGFRVLTVLALVMLLWTTISESLHRSRNVHRDLTTQCPTAKTGLFGGGAFLALDAALFWLVCQMLTLNARSDYLDEDDTKGEYVDVCTTEFDVAETHLPTA